MNAILKSCILGLGLCFLFFDFCATADSIRPQLPAEVSINKEAGRGGWIIVTVQSERGEGLPFIVDTGSPFTVFDKSLEPELGKRLETMTMFCFGSKQSCGIYAAPKLLLGNTALMTGDRVIAYDFKRIASYAGQPIKGIIGMDCLCHYCVQLDFEAGKMRFLDAGPTNASQLGKTFPLVFSSQNQSKTNWVCPFIHHAGLLGSSTNLLIDTADNLDGRAETGTITGHYLARFFGLAGFGSAYVQEFVWDGETYTKLKIGISQHANRLGLSFLARHLVTFDFPNRKMYLKKINAGPLADKK